MKEIKNFESQTIAAQQNRKERDYWLDKLSGEIVKSRFPYDRARTYINETKQEVIKFTFSPEVLSRLLKISSGFDPNLYTILAAAVMLLLNRYTGNKDILVGIPVLKQDIQADFINSVLVLRQPVAGALTFKEFLLMTRQTIAGAMENQNYPVETLVYKLDLEYNETDFPLFDVAVLLENIQDKGYLHPIKPNMVFSFLKTGQSIEGELEYNALLYEKSTVLGIIGHLKNLLEGVIFNAGIKIADIEILSNEEKKRLLVDFNNNHTDFPMDKTVYHFIEKHAAAGPHRTAVVSKDETLTYGELNRRVNRLARVLKDNGIRRGHLAGILLNRSPLMVECILACWKVGCAYIPMDTDSPVRRITGIMTDSAASVLFTRQAHIRPELEKDFNGTIIT